MKPSKAKLTPRERVTKNINEFVATITADNLPVPASGDCFICRFNSDTCLSTHLKERYLHGSLLVNAMRERGYADPAIGYHYTIKSVDVFRRALRSYLKKRLLPKMRRDK